MARVTGVVNDELARDRCLVEYAGQVSDTAPNLGHMDRSEPKLQAVSMHGPARVSAERVTSTRRFAASSATTDASCGGASHAALCNPASTPVSGEHPGKLIARRVEQRPETIRVHLTHAPNVASKVAVGDEIAEDGLCQDR